MASAYCNVCSSVELIARLSNSTCQLSVRMPDTLGTSMAFVNELRNAMAVAHSPEK